MKPEKIQDHIDSLGTSDYGQDGKNLKALVKKYFKEVEKHHYGKSEGAAGEEAERRMILWWQRINRQHTDIVSSNARGQGWWFDGPKESWEKPVFFKTKWGEYLKWEKRYAKVWRTMKTPARTLGLLKKKTESPTTAASAELGVRGIGDNFTPLYAVPEKNGGKNKRKGYSVNKINVLGKQRKVYKFVGNKKKYIKCKNKYVLLKKYKEMQMKKTKVKKTKVKKTTVKKTKVKKKQQ